ncbi:hypothetical protein M1P97_09165 [Parabacteroides sp. GYB001]|uniref:hypothetical protein n=1 Tax=Parabacteroides leei TaxID=2939491 RepID=UPI0020183DAA|nr:hypothetical protein [Parabacteroides leei]MCL3851454.1 hypothetical protein [Parabacteroides leei]
MKGDVYIDEIDIFSAYGANVTDGLDSLFLFPAIKEPESNDWPEEDGIEVDLETVHLQAKDITLTFMADNPNDLIARVSEPGYHTIRVTAYNKEWSVRLSSQPSNKIIKQAAAFSLKFTEDQPERPIRPDSYTPGTWVKDTGHYIDEVNLKNYGVEVYEGIDEITKSPTVKQNLLRGDISVIDGQIYDTGSLVFNNKDVTFKCLFVASNMVNFWSCYNAFFSKIIEPNERSLTVEATGLTYPVYYKKTGNFKIRSSKNKIMIEFSLTLGFTSFRVEGKQYILAAEDGRYVVTEDGLNYIDMNIYGEG